MIWSIVIIPANANPASANDCSIERTCVTTSVVCRFHLSTQTPASGPSMKVGICPANPTMPKRNAEPVKRYTNQLVAMRVIHVPMSETLCPAKNNR